MRKRRRKNNGFIAITSASLLLLGGMAMAKISTKSPEVVTKINSHIQQKIFTASEGLDIAYREAGDPANPTILLLHGFPTSSHMYRKLIPILAVNYHILAPDYPGYGNSSQPPPDKFEYSFANMAELMKKFLRHKQVNQYALYLMDYGAPVGFRLFAQDPTRVSAFIVQNGNAYEEGLRDFWDPIKKYWKSGNLEDRDELRNLLTIEATKWQYTHGAEDVTLISSDNWFHDQYLLDRPGNKEIQLDMFYDYRTNVSEYPKWQKLFRKMAPPTIVLWGKNDVIFPEEGAHPYRRDIKDIELHLLNAGHFPLEEKVDEMSHLIIDFLKRKL